MKRKYVYRLSSMAILLLGIFLLNGCGNKSEQTVNSAKATQSAVNSTPTQGEATPGVTLEPDKVEQLEPIVWSADLTQDGIDEKISVDLTYVINYPETGEEKTVSVYSGATGDEIWTGHADTVHPGWNGIYIYNDGSHDYLLLWKPMMYQGIASYSIQAFSLTEEGESQELFNESLEFDLNRPEECDKQAISAYVDKVNGYLKNSYVLVDTDNGTPVYSTKDNKLKHLYDASDILEEIEALRENSMDE
jgi:hypothetical protein